MIYRKIRNFENIISIYVGNKKSTIPECTFVRCAPDGGGSDFFIAQLPVSRRPTHVGAVRAIVADGADRGENLK